MRRAAPGTRASLPGLSLVTLAGVVLFSATPGPGRAQPAALVKDIVTSGVNSPEILFFGTQLVELDGALYFFADDGVHGRELWRSDGTPAGTSMVRDLCPGQCVGCSVPDLVVHQGVLYFSAHDGVHGRELWRSDGTFAGTELVADVFPGGSSSNPAWLTSLGERLLFTASDEDGRELWRTDGTSTGTVQVLDIHSSGSSTPGSFVTWKGAAWFTAADGTHGRELWTTDGTPAGTQLIQDVRPGPEDGLTADQTSLTRFFTPAPFGDLLLFPADDGVHGRELWATDGTAAGTALVLDIEPGAWGSDSSWLTPFAGEVYFQADQTGTGRELWKSDGTAGGTALVRDIEPGPDGFPISPLVVAGGYLFFPGFTSAEGRELWRSDGTTAGTELVEDLNPGPSSALSWAFAFGLQAFGDRLLFQADDGVHGLEPWISDGTPEGTELLGDVNPGAGWAFGQFYFAPLFSGTLGGQALFFAFDADLGWELRSTGGVPGDVALVRDIDDQASSIPMTFFFRYTELADVGGTLFFLALDPEHGAELWASDGTGAGTRLVRDLEPGPLDGFPIELTPLGDLLLFVGPGDGTWAWLWTSDGTEAGTSPLAAAPPFVEPRELTRFGELAYFIARYSPLGPGLASQAAPSEAGVDPRSLPPIGDPSLWRTDGTSAGTQPFFAPLPGLPSPWELAAGPAQLFIATASELWTTAGDAASTQKLADVEARDLAPAGSLLFFSGDDGATGPELWVSDGTPGGTHPVVDLLPGPEGAVPFLQGFGLPFPDGPGIVGVAYPPSAFFVADDGVHGPELLWSDGTEAGTRFLGDLRPGPVGSEPRYLTLVGSILYFVADDGVHGAELWRSDGTEAGTFLLADLEPGSGSSVPDSLTAVYGELFFSAWRAGDGRELWRSDGTAAGTVLLQDIHPGAGSSSPSYFATSGDRLFFVASDGELGFELWALRAVAPSLVGTKQVAGDLRAGGHATYLITLHNPGDFDQHDNPGDELLDELPAGMIVTAAGADSGTVAVDPDGRTVRWNGAVPAGATVTITVEAAITLGAAGTRLENQAQIAYDADGTGDNETLAVTDDPAAGGAADPTAFVAAQPQLLEIPTLGTLPLALLALLLAGTGLLLARTR